MNLILEGTDGTFKTTVANKLSRELKLPIKRGSSFELASGSNKEMFNFSKSLITDGADKIIERFIHSNRVYCMLYPEYTSLTKNQRHQLERKMKHNSIIIYLTASSETIIDRIEERGDEYITTDKIPKILNMYNSVMSDAIYSGIRVYTYDTGVLSSDDIVEQITRLPELQRNSSYINCHECNKSLKKEDSFFNQTHCFTCYLKIMTDIFATGSE